MEIQFALFEHLLKAPSKDYINRLLIEAFVQRDNSKIPDSILKYTAESLEIDQKTSEQLIKEVGTLIKKVIFDGLNDLSQIQSLFASSTLQANLKNLLSKLLLEKIPQFKKALVDDQYMMPKLVDFDWRVDIKMASNLSTSDSSSKSGQQTCILQLKIQEAEEFANQTPRIEHLNLELTKQTLSTMLDGLTKIKDQLNSVAAK